MAEEKKEHGQKVTRRGFIDVALKGGLCVWAAAMAAPTVVYLWPASSSGARKSSASVGNAKDFAVGTAKLLQGNDDIIMVIRMDEERYKAFSAVCSHLGCTVKWDSATKNILCPCHAGVFNADGKVVSGPPPKPLREYEVAIVKEEVVVKL